MINQIFFHISIVHNCYYICVIEVIIILSTLWKLFEKECEIVQTSFRHCKDLLLF